MKILNQSPFWNAFVGYTLLGYLSLGLHHWVFFPYRGEQATDLGMILMLGNLMLGSFCFYKALQESLSWWRSRREDAP